MIIVARRWTITVMLNGVGGLHLHRFVPGPGCPRYCLVIGRLVIRFGREYA